MKSNISLTLEKELITKLKEEALRDNRSLSAYIELKLKGVLNGK